MSWLCISVEVEEGFVEALSEALLVAGAQSVEVTDARAGSPAERAVFADAGGSRVWGRSRVSALVQEEANAAGLFNRACAQAGIAPPPHRLARIADQDWVRASQSQFSPIRISARLWIVPGWSSAPDPGAVNIMLDPGLAFGTGSHPTTCSCLRWLERTIRGGESVIDYGCGSGILAIAALKLGAARATGVDIDEQALLAARRNAMQNQVEARFCSAAGDILQPAQVVVANILAGPLIVLAPLLARTAAPRGQLALAGLLEAQADEVCAAYRPWFEFEAPALEEGWVLLSGVRI